MRHRLPMLVLLCFATACLGACAGEPSADAASDAADSAAGSAPAANLPAVYVAQTGPDDSRGAAFVTAIGGSTWRLTPWHGAPLRDPHLTAGGEWLVYACAKPKPGWYAAKAAAKTTPALRLVAPPLSDSEQWWAERPLVLADWVVYRKGDTLAARSLSGPASGLPVALLNGGLGRLAVHETSNRVVAVQDTRVVSVPLESGAWGNKTVVLDAGEGIYDIVVIPKSDRIVAVTGKWPKVSLVAAAVDGSESVWPKVIATGLPGPLTGLLPTPDGKRLLVHTAGYGEEPELERLHTMPADADGLSTLAPVAPPGYRLWAASPPASGFLIKGGPLVTPDGKHALLVDAPAGSVELYSAATDGSQSEQPVWLGYAWAPTVGARPFASDGRILLGAFGGPLVGRPGVEGSLRKLGGYLEGSVDALTWTPDDCRVVFSIHAFEWEQLSTVFVIRADKAVAVAWPLVPPDWPPSRIVGVTTDGSEALIESGAGGNQSIYRVRLGLPPGALPVPLTSIDEAADTLVGFVGLP